MLQGGKKNTQQYQFSDCSRGYYAAHFLYDSAGEILAFDFIFLLLVCLMIRFLEDEINTNEILNLSAHFQLKSENYFESNLLFLY